MRCIVCDTALERTRWDWLHRCPQCGAWRSTLDFGADEVDTEDRTASLESLRRSNFRLILDAIGRARPLSGARLLEVGSGHGWFLGEAAQRGAVPLGIERDEGVAQHAGTTVRLGLFPEALQPGERFDVIAYNDVLEHIEDAPAALDATRDALDDGGLLSLNIPTSDGIAYRAATLLTRVGVSGPFLRLWQYGLGSPHMHYLPRRALVRLLERHGFEVLALEPIPAITRKGLWQRVHVLHGPTPGSVVQFAVLWLAAGVLNARRLSDTVLLVGRRR
jgi:2-polyprenyl-3-methyl-5-hydroxy-6-metoxy-1,4-benzoquinol methylase